jgi:sugar lactone lactonase YvrE
MKKNIIFSLLILISTLSFAQIINTLAGTGISGFSGDGGPATAAEIKNVNGIAVDGSGNIYIGDDYNYRLRKIDPSGIISTIAGNGTSGFSGDGGQATAAELSGAGGIAFDGAGNIYLCDGINRIRRISNSGIITTFAGNGTTGYSGDGGQATNAELWDPREITFDGSGNLYVADEGNTRVRKISTSGIITSIAGNGLQGYSGDGGQATAAEFWVLSDIKLDASGNIYIVDSGNHRIRVINSLGIVTTIAGNGTAGYSGDGGQATAAELGWLDNMAIDHSGNIYITDWSNSVVREVNASGIITTFAGTGIGGFSGDGGPATAAKLNSPSGLAVDLSGNIYIGDINNNRVRVISLPLGVNEIANSNEIKLFPNPNNGKFTLEVKSEELRTKSDVEVYNMLGERIYSSPFTINHLQFSIDISGQPAGIYLYRVLSETDNLISEGKFIIE